MAEFKPTHRLYRQHWSQPREGILAPVGGNDWLRTKGGEEFLIGDCAGERLEAITEPETGDATWAVQQMRRGPEVVVEVVGYSGHLRRIVGENVQGLLPGGGNHDWRDVCSLATWPEFVGHYTFRLHTPAPETGKCPNCGESDPDKLKNVCGSCGLEDRVIRSGSPETGSLAWAEAELRAGREVRNRRWHEASIWHHVEGDEVFYTVATVSGVSVRRYGLLPEWASTQRNCGKILEWTSRPRTSGGAFVKALKEACDEAHEAPNVLGKTTWGSDPRSGDAATRKDAGPSSSEEGTWTSPEQGRLLVEARPCLVCGRWLGVREGTLCGEHSEAWLDSFENHFDVWVKRERYRLEQEKAQLGGADELLGRMSKDIDKAFVRIAENMRLPK